jgi:peptidoglycan/LPS O-acetylase OafA/YrhL
MGLSNPVFEFIAIHGNIGVDVFFVISGYEMAKTPSGLEQDWGVGTYFLIKRFACIYPGYWLKFLKPETVKTISG